MTTQYAYRLIPESSVPASARSTARGALALAAELEGISRPTLLWFLPADRPGHQVFRESPRPLAGWTERDRIYLAADLPDREVWETVGHECAHIYAALSGYATMITSDRKATEQQVDAAHESYARSFSQRFTQLSSG